jgi:hypothetical protein
MSTENAYQETPFTCCGVEWHKAKLPMVDGTHLFASRCLVCGKGRTVAPPQLSESEKGADRLRSAWYGNAMHQGITWDKADALDKEDWLAVYDEAVKMAAEKPAPSADPAGVEELAKALTFPLPALPGNARTGRVGLTWEEAKHVAAAAIAHCGQREAEQRQRAEKAEAENLHWQSEHTALKMEYGNQAAEVERLKEELARTKSGADETGCWCDDADLGAAKVRRESCPVHGQASQPAPEGLPEVDVGRLASGLQRVFEVGLSWEDYAKQLCDAMGWRRVAQPEPSKESK